MHSRAILIACLSLTLLLLAAGAQESQPSEYQVKAAFLFNFAKFVEWPPETFAVETSPLVIGIMGDNPFGGALESTIQNKTINNRSLVIKSLHSLAEATNCQILFINASEKKRFAEIFQSLHRSSILTVSETEGFTEAGGMINFVLENKKIRFQINDEAAKAARLKISSKLLTLAIHSTR
jgi:YfiR/HmsC-like